MRPVLLDEERCVGCQICELVCFTTWQKVFNPLKSQIRIESMGWYGGFKTAVCRQEEDADCVKVCRTGGLHLDKKEV